MERPATPREQPNDAVGAGLVACVTAFASAVKNLTIYPAAHPRVVARAAEFADEFASLAPTGCELTFAGEGLLLDGAPVASDHLALDWLVRRGRDAGLRGVRLEPRCRADDVVTFAAALLDCRPGTREGMLDRWQHPELRVQPLALVVDDVRRDAPAPTTRRRPPAADGRPTDVGGGVAATLEQVARSDSVRDLLRGIEAASGDDPLGARELNLIEMIGELLPVDGPTDLDGMTAIVERILARVQGEMQDIMRTNARVRGAELLRSAVGMARTFFGRAAPECAARAALPMGRPEDDSITADLDALLAEFRALPDAADLRLPSAAALDAGAPTTTRELLGVCLHGLARCEDPGRWRERLALLSRLVGRDQEAAAELLDTYMTPVDDDVAPVAARLAILAALVADGHAELVGARRYLDEDLLQAGFPEVLRVAAAAFTRDDEHARLRRALATLTPMLENGGYEATAESGVLDEPAVTRLLARAQGQQALTLLSRCAADDPEVLRALRDYVGTLELPPAEAATLALLPREAVPPAYLRRLLRAAAQRRFDEPLRRASGELLREHVREHRLTLPLPTLERAIDALRHAPSAETEALLDELRRVGRLVNFGPRARATRRAAREALAAMHRRRNT